MSVFDENITTNCPLEDIKRWMIYKINNAIDCYIAHERFRFKNHYLPLCDNDETRRSHIWDELTSIWDDNTNYLKDHGVYDTSTKVEKSKNPLYKYDVSVIVYLTSTETQLVHLVEMSIINDFEYGSI